MRYLLFSWLSFFSILSCIGFVSVQCLQDQKLLLLQLKQSISFSPSATSNLTSWDTNTDCCSSWDGIKCDGSDHVIGLDLNNKSISGIKNWTTLFELKYLESLNFSFNSFNSSIPSGLDKLANLSHLNLSNSGFVGQIPIDISRMKRLVSLDLSTLFATSKPLKLENPNLKTLVRHLSELRELYLDGVNISMHGIEWSHALSSAIPNLQVLSLSNCYLSGLFDPSILKLQFLSKLRLDYNNISAQVPEFLGNFSNLSFLFLSNCGLLGMFPEKIFQLTSLRSLDVSANPSLQGFLPEFPQNGSLENLVLSGSNFSGNLPESTGNLRFLRRLELMSCDFSGSIPTSFSKLTHLQYLDLSINNFNGSIPKLGSSVNLTKINLAHNRLSGPISSSQWDGHKKLASLNFRNNSLNGTIPQTLFTLPLLQNLDLSQNQFTGQLGQFPSGSSLVMQTFDVSNNMLEGSVPLSIFNVSTLKILALSSNNLSGTLQLDRFQNLRNLSSLDLSGNKLTIYFNVTSSALFPQLSTLKLGSCNLKTFPDFLRNQSKLLYLDLSNNQIQGKIPNWIGKIGNGSLTSLNLSSNTLQNPYRSLPSHEFSSLLIVDLHSNLLQGSIPILPPSASVLDYSNNYLSSIIQEDIASYLNDTLFVSLSNNSFSGEIPLSICNAQYIQVLDLSNNSLNGPIPACLGGNSNINVLNLRSNKLSGNIPESFSGECSLRTLDLNENKLEGKVPTSLSNCMMLEVLDLGKNQISGQFPCWLGKMSHLRVLVLRENNFSGSIPHSETNNTFPVLQIIDLSSNQFTGSLPSTQLLRWKGMMAEEQAEQKNFLRFGYLEQSGLYFQDTVTVTSKGQQMVLVKILTIFTSMDFSNNKFEGEIPEEIGNLTALYVLNLSSNALSGSIPPSLGNLRHLESLDLSRNKLSGELPSQLGDLTFLSVLCLSFNQFVGRIPKGSQLQNMVESAFEGNAGLCGPPLSKSCTDTVLNLPIPSTELCKLSSLSSNCPGGYKRNWLLIYAALGWGVGVGLAACVVAFWKPWNRLCIVISKSLLKMD
ncbi:hypothetical protein ACHQM5_020736 [Ranunculus cassubicifolius]